MKKTSFYEWLTHKVIDGLIGLIETFSEKAGQHSLLARFKAKCESIQWQYVFWTLFIMVFLHVYVLLFLENIVLIIALDLIAGGLLLFLGPERVWLIIRTSIPGRLLMQLFDPNK
ncbi:MULTISPECIES: hypothetical protein [Aneurinibacillus]|uniref:Uncharacterized protein n=1 Tax=Aneurinibacillus thermoaerophilus TaxID=143495 RepID=A0A1G8D8A5_ANETH|nr:MULTISPECIES: hypothetical protein [Aneurinibacillus]AMA72033.1 hypothetical protein ACH33_03695 [Aneurinibacillus sp. XH2]MED0677005.1 hypothetical protein [Aneurinibacillus thermoaerophilus]MED0679316.1 hypothetical protein [Aneurinibacillus thermoaerophilus]MED0737202.1 hypothetical protein [Aneurinibacillus thermoaerophilus]MED0757248.1 hypothetical protein [Aneurinibacillus thermoaerophilus]